MRSGPACRSKAIGLGGEASSGRFGMRSGSADPQNDDQVRRSGARYKFSYIFEHSEHQ